MVLLVSPYQQCAGVPVTLKKFIDYVTIVCVYFPILFAPFACCDGNKLFAFLRNLSALSIFPAFRAATAISIQRSDSSRFTSMLTPRSLQTEEIVNTNFIDTKINILNNCSLLRIVIKLIIDHLQFISPSNVMQIIELSCR